MPDAVVVGSGPERPGRGDHDGARRPLGAGRRAGGDRRRRGSLGRADRARIRARRLFRDPSFCSRVAVLHGAAACGARTGARPPRCAPRASAGRRNRCHARAVGRGDGRRARSGRAGLPEADRAAGPGARPARAVSARPPPVSAPPHRRRPVRPQCVPLRRRAGAAASRASGGRRCSWGSRRTRCSRCAAARLRRSGSSSPCSATPYGWPVARGGSQAIADALVSYLRSLGGEVETGRPVASVDELPPSVVTLLDLTPQGVIGVAGHWLPDRVPAGVAPVPLRPRRVQARLGARRPRAVDGGGVHARGNRAHRRHGGRDRRVRGRRLARRGAGPART